MTQQAIDVSVSYVPGLAAALCRGWLAVALLGLAACGPPPDALPADPVDGELWTQATIGLGFRFIPRGTFLMGSPVDEVGRDDDDEAPHPVELTRSFWMGETEVTQAQWKQLVGNNPSYARACGDDCPVERVSWFEAVTFANLLSEKAGLRACYEIGPCSGTLGGGCVANQARCDGDYSCPVAFLGPDCRGYRLPTEAEWEYAARAGTQTALYTGDLTLLGANNAPELDAIAWYGGNSAVSYPGGYDCSEWPETQVPAQRCGPQPVGRKQANGWKLLDMLGNVWEWTQDWTAPYPEFPVTDPMGLDRGFHRVDRGCGWVADARRCRAAARGRSAPVYRGSILGFRLVRTHSV